MPADAPEFLVSQWLNTEKTIAMEELRGRIVILHAFQMQDPVCDTLGLPQIEIIDRNFSGPDVVVIGLYNHPEPITPQVVSVLDALIRDHKLSCAIGLDMPSSAGPLSETMKRYGMQGTPSTIVIDRYGRIRGHQFAPVDPLSLGFLVGLLLLESLVKKAGTQSASSIHGVTIDVEAVQAGAESKWSMACL